MERVQKILSNFGYCSRRKAETLIEEGRVSVNGKVISLGDKAKSDDVIKVNGKRVLGEKKRYLMLNKPLKYVTAVKDPYHKTVMELVDVKERVFPIGRLDYNTTGLLLFTNDGDFANNIMHPRYEVTKTYRVCLDKPITNRLIKEMERGVELEDGKTSRCHIVREEGLVLRVKIHEGRNRIIRRMFKAVEYKVRNLSRIGVGKLELGGLKEGEFRELTEKEKKLIFE